MLSAEWLSDQYGECQVTAFLDAIATLMLLVI